MKHLEATRFMTFTILAVLLIGQTSCVIIQRKNSGRSPGHDNGKHKGWYKNTNNPHHPNTTNPGKEKQKEKGHSKK